MILDRMRICELLDHCSDETLAELRVMGYESWLDREARAFTEPPVPVLGEAKDAAASA
jgi:hypothetical protein